MVHNGVPCQKTDVGCRRADDNPPRGRTVANLPTAVQIKCTCREGGTAESGSRAASCLAQLCVVGEST